MRSSRRTAGWRITEGPGAALARLGALAQLALPGLAPRLTRSLAAPGLVLGERLSLCPLPEEPQRLGGHRGSPAPLWLQESLGVGMLAPWQWPHHHVHHPLSQGSHGPQRAHPAPGIATGSLLG